MRFNSFVNSLADIKAQANAKISIDAPLILLGAGAVVAQPFVTYALQHLKVQALVDNARQGQTEAGVPIIGDEGLRTLLGSGFSGAGILCCGSEGALNHFKRLWTSNAHLISYFEAMAFIDDPKAYGPILGFLRAFSNIDEIKSIYEYGHSLFDEPESLKTLETILRYRLTWDDTHLLPQARPLSDIYFDQDILNIRQDEVFIDGGAYDGDTARAFVARTKGEYDHIHAFELDPSNHEKTHAGLKGMARTTIYECGLWSHTDHLVMEDQRDKGSRISDQLATNGVQGQLRALDDVVEKASFIKFDIEGAEARALQGAFRIISQYKPKLAICAYHRADDLLVLPRKIKALRPDYRLRLRHYSPIIFDTVIYAD
jgi:FkbM family methyltransferase